MLTLLFSLERMIFVCLFYCLVGYFFREALIGAGQVESDDFFKDLFLSFSR